MKLIRRLHANVYHSLYQAGAPQWGQILSEVAIIFFSNSTISQDIFKNFQSIIHWYIRKYLIKLQMIAISEKIGPHCDRLPVVCSQQGETN